MSPTILSCDHIYIGIAWSTGLGWYRVWNFWRCWFHCNVICEGCQCHQATQELPLQQIIQVRNHIFCVYYSFLLLNNITQSMSSVSVGYLISLYSFRGDRSIALPMQSMRSTVHLWWFIPRPDLRAGHLCLSLYIYIDVPLPLGIMSE